MENIHTDVWCKCLKEFSLFFLQAMSLHRHIEMFCEFMKL